MDLLSVKTVEDLSQLGTPEDVKTLIQQQVNQESMTLSDDTVININSLVCDANYKHLYEVIRVYQVLHEQSKIKYFKSNLDKLAYYLIEFENANMDTEINFTTENAKTWYREHYKILHPDKLDSPHSQIHQETLQALQKFIKENDLWEELEEDGDSNE